LNLILKFLFCFIFFPPFNTNKQTKNCITNAPQPTKSNNNHNNNNNNNKSDLLLGYAAGTTTTSTSTTTSTTISTFNNTHSNTNNTSTPQQPAAAASATNQLYSVQRSASLKDNSMYYRFVLHSTRPKN